MKDMHNHCVGQHRALAMQGLTRRILVRLCLGILVMCGITFASIPVLADDDDIVVPRDFPTIQAAVDAAQPGDTIKVRKGTYTEEIVIAKDLNLKGAGKRKTVIKAPPTLTPFALDLQNGNPVVSVVRVTDGARVSLSGFTVAGPIPCSVTVAGIRAVKAATLKLTDSRVTRIRPEDGTCLPENAFGQAVVIGLPSFPAIDGQGGSTGHGRITHVRIDRYQRTGILVVGPRSRGAPPPGFPSTATISHNLVTGGAQIPVAGQTGIIVQFGAVAQVTGNTVRGNVCTDAVCGPDPINEFQSAGIGAVVVPPGSEISENHVSDNDIGIYQLGSPNCCTISKNRVKNNRFFGIVVQSGDGTTSENIIRGGEVGIGVVADFADTVGVLQGDRIRRTSMAPVQELECCGFTATAIVQRPKPYGRQD